MMCFTDVSLTSIESHFSSMVPKPKKITQPHPHPVCFPAVPALTTVLLYAICTQCCRLPPEVQYIFQIFIFSLFK